ncbi:Protein arginine methyltransferase NDUFAF7, mitochondrial [Ceratocystis fimbriata CBS 114723]|uniref:Protein arginine methyltransferase NDUFAF7 n=1 Tax=Ceratocystis fimbriata CBS 114723 TaxID=1035309 RepID=A0A2C5WXH4_9PEZI|nr:Protein arginine methyltransferase NDUFAF7, mitochondrial [Ceratocystis fimbriata CBS 114723]
MSRFSLPLRALTKPARAAVLPVRRPLTRPFSVSCCLRDDISSRKWSTPLSKRLAEAISITGPIPVASYMRMCLTSDIGGYYTGALGKDREQIGLKGDFITSPEISPLFGQIVGLWFITEWMAQNANRPLQDVDIIEVGPGRGTLMSDAMRIVSSHALVNRVKNIYMVEASAEMRLEQKKRLCGEEAPLVHDKAAGIWTCMWKGKAPVQITWVETIQSVPKSPERMPLIVAHEFFDALPIHIFQSVPVSGSDTKHTPSSPPAPTQVSPETEKSAVVNTEWRELVVAPSPPDATHQSLKTPPIERVGAVPDFQLHCSQGHTRHSRFLPEMHERYRSAKSKPGTVIEICPDADMYASDFAARIGGNDSFTPENRVGAALIIDYGQSDAIPANSLRGIKEHQRVSAFSEPGLVDLSADVDFKGLADAFLDSSEHVEVHGPVMQGDFLSMMGMKEQARTIAESIADKALAEKIRASAERLMDKSPSGMGKVYKMLAVIPENSGRRVPVGFGGDIPV